VRLVPLVFTMIATLGRRNFRCTRPAVTYFDTSKKVYSYSRGSLRSSRLAFVLCRPLLKVEIQWNDAM
jgi:hypothetical protein